ncbi:MAG: flippase-like domain-containing protein [Chloroflexi bacterium]|nr:flippase-like domain-containing protein [Chloroflexota bacterium]
MKRWHFVLGLLISAGFLYLALKGMQLEAFWEALKHANYWWLLPGIAVYFVAVWVRAWRWHYLIRPLKPVPTRTMFRLVSIGYMGNNIYPARAGEVLRAVLLKRHEGVSVSAALSTILVERVYDGVIMLSFVFLNLPELARLKADSGLVGSIQTLAIGGAVAFLGALAAFLLAAMFPEKAEAVLVWSMRFVPRRFREPVLSVGRKFLSGLEALRSPKEALMVFLTSLVIWLLETSKYWFVMHAFPFEVSFFTLMLMNGVVNLATTLPSAPGYVGTFDTPGIAVLTAYGVEKSLAAGYTLVLHVALWLPITLVGAYFLAQEGIKPAELEAQMETEDASS